MNNSTLKIRFFSLLILLINLSPILSLDYQCQLHFPPDDISFPRGLNRSIESFGLEKIILTADDSRFIELRRHANNLRYDANAAYIALPKTSSDVMEILRFAMANDLRPTVRSGKHCYEDFWSNNTGGVLIDMSRMDKIYQLRNDPTIWVESGTLIGRLYDILFSDYGLTAPVALCADVGVGGNVLGGGYGHLVRKYGPIIDYVDTFEMVYVDAKKRVGLVQAVANSSVDNENCDMHVGIWVGRSKEGFLHESDLHNILSDGGSYYLQRSAYMVGEIPQHQLDAVWIYMTDPAYSFLNYGDLQFNGYGCAVGQHSEDATAYPHRHAVVKLQYGTAWYASDNADDHWNWSRDFYREMYGEEGPRPDDVMDGCFMNYPNGELIDWQHLYFKGNYEKLKHVKMQWIH